MDPEGYLACNGLTLSSSVVLRKLDGLLSITRKAGVLKSRRRHDRYGRVSISILLLRRQTKAAARPPLFPDELLDHGACSGSKVLGVSEDVPISLS